MSQYVSSSGTHMRALRFIISKNAQNGESLAKFVETLLQSDLMKGVYYDNVKSLTRHNQSFGAFYEGHLSYYLKEGSGKKFMGEVFSKVLCQPPYNIGFGAYLIAEKK